jgi:hypothetical protein
VVVGAGLTAFCAFVGVPRRRARRASVKVNQSLASRSAVNAAAAAGLEQSVPSAAPRTAVDTVNNAAYELPVPARTYRTYDEVDPETDYTNKEVIDAVIRGDGDEGGATHKFNDIFAAPPGAPTTRLDHELYVLDGVATGDRRDNQDDFPAPQPGSATHLDDYLYVAGDDSDVRA